MPSERTLFELRILPHLDAAYNLARWLTRNEHDAEDVVQEAMMRALRFFGGFQESAGGRSWLLTIVRNTFLTWRERNRKLESQAGFDENDLADPHEGTSPDAPLVTAEDSRLVREALEQLPWEFREVVVLRDLEGLSYKEISGITDIPLGTVMSRIARARERLRGGLAKAMQKEA